MSLLAFLFGYGKGKPESFTARETPRFAETRVPVPAHGAILVQNGTVELVLKAIESHAGLDAKEVPKQFRITIANESNGGVLVRFPDGAPPYDIVNLISWLNNPPGIQGVSSAKGWITSPSTGLGYSLKPEISNGWGDTLVGASSDGRSVRVYLPEATMCEISQVIIADPAPASGPIGAKPQLTINVVMDVATDFGNHAFEITHQKDTEWTP